MVGREEDLTAIAQAVADSPKRDNSVYHKAMAEARQAFEAAEAVLGGPVEVETKTKLKRNGQYVVKWIFRPAE
ncbi:hypothetical protein [Rhizobium grahamii]|uniref:Uncharacterized protein n=1 Tax=Rhizobium grahamii CCGE 502 TaxID=990285 RepID=S3HAM2_9HYPH|nr:hypothetical protein [Rhizobium grahamii]EPE95260.1 hypothetical protein RGCCGE502_25278 [Rhizobium grahamii CCGE 502]